MDGRIHPRKRNGTIGFLPGMDLNFYGLGARMGCSLFSCSPNREWFRGCLIELFNEEVNKNGCIYLRGLLAPDAPTWPQIDWPIFGNNVWANPLLVLLWDPI